MKQLDTAHHDFTVQPYKTGIKILRPTKLRKGNYPRPFKNITVGNVLALPCNVYILNHESKVVNGNLANARTMDCDSVSESIGKSALDVCTRESSAHFLANDRLVARNEKALFLEEMADKEEEAPSINYFSMKLPWYDQNDKILGVFGFSVVLGKQSLAESLSTISGLGLLHGFQSKINSLNHIYALNIEKINLTPRESYILNLMIKGKRCPEIALITKLSKRTVEHYIENIRQKFNVSNKSELIEKAIHIIQTFHLAF